MVTSNSARISSTICKVGIRTYRESFIVDVERHVLFV